MNKWYKIIFKQLQPIHIGAGRFGVLGQTRIFIPGWTMWGALTKAFNIEQGISLDENQDMFETITNFFPTDDPNGQNIWFPSFKKGYFYLGDYREDHFRAEFCNVFMSTAVQPVSRQAKDSSLHESEFILPKSKNNKKQLYWVGWIELEKIEDIPEEIYIGGDRRYGYGLLKLKKDKIKNENPPEDKSIWFVEYKVARNNFEFGELELIPEFEYYNSDGEGNYKFTNASYFYIPGTISNPIEPYNTIKGKITEST